jgi:hypothetical protein
MQNLSEKAAIILNLGWTSIKSDPEYAFKCAEDVMFWYFDGIKNNNYLRNEELKEKYAEALELRHQILIPKYCLELLLIPELEK